MDFVAFMIPMTMVELHKLDTAALVDQLAIRMAEYLNLSREEGTHPERFAKCFLAIKAIQAELETRNKKEVKSESE